MNLNIRFRIALTKLISNIITFGTVSVNVISQLLTRLNLHTGAKGNVHGLEKRDLNIELVPNFPVATTQQAKDGKSSSAFMSPRRVDDYADANIYKPLADLFTEATNNLN